MSFHDCLPFLMYDKKGEKYGSMGLVCFDVYLIYVSCFVLNNRASFEGEFYLLPIFCFIAYIFCHHQKRGDCWPKGYNPGYVF